MPILDLRKTDNSRFLIADFGFGIIDRRSEIAWRSDSHMDEEELKDRTKSFALDIIKLVNMLPRTPVGDTIGRQLVKAGTSVGANYRSACRSRSRSEFASKLGIVEEEADESAFWLEVISETGLLEQTLVHALLDEADQLVAIMVASRKSLNRKSTM